MSLLVVTGADGAGKSTVSAALVERLNATWGPGTAQQVQIWQAIAGLLTPQEARAYLGRIGHRSRALFLLHGISRALDIGEEAGTPWLVFDGYWYKYALTELEHGAPPALFDGLKRAFPKPDLTVCLDLPTEVAAQRKGTFSAYERGFDSAEDAAGAFLAFQERLADRWRVLESEVGPWSHLDGRLPIHALVDAIFREMP